MPFILKTLDSGIPDNFFSLGFPYYTPLQIFRTSSLIHKQNKKMERKSLPGRPTGTDGSDFSYRMVVDSRYMKVAKGKSRLKPLIAIQTLSQVIGSICMLLNVTAGKKLDKTVVISTCTGFMALLIGEIGRRKSLGSMLRVYIILSSIVASFSLVHFSMSHSTAVIHDADVSAKTKYEIFEAVRVFAGVVLQIIIIITANSLVQNMSLPKRSS